MKVYLEYKDRSSEKFWEITVSGSSHTVRYGKLGAKGTQKTKDFPSGEAAQFDAEGLIRKKVAKGYVEVSRSDDAPAPMDAPAAIGEPVGEGYVPLTEEQLALFTSAKLDHLNGFQNEYWDREFELLLKRTVYATKTRMEYLSKEHALAKEFEEIAQYEPPQMDRQVVRNEEGVVTDIDYRINGLLLLRLRNSTPNQYYRPPIFPFFGEQHDGGWAYLFGRRKDIVAGSIALLEQLPSFVAEHLAKIDEAEREHSKSTKIKDMAETSIAMMVEDGLKGSGWEYSIEDGKSADILRAKLGEKLIIELNLSHKTFLKKIGDLLPTLEATKSIVEEVGMDMLLGIKYSDFELEWGETLYFNMSEGYKQRDYVSSNPHAKFWRAEFERYAHQAFAGKVSKSTGDAFEDYLTEEEILAMAEWQIPGVELKLLRQAKAWPLSILCYVDGIPIINLAQRYIELLIFNRKSIGDLWFNRGFYYAPEDYRPLLEGLPTFYHETNPKYQTEMQDIRLPAQEIRHALQGHELALDLRPGTQKAFVQVKGKKILLLRHEGNMEGMADDIRAKVELVEATMKQCKLQFKVLPRGREHKWLTWKKG